MGSAALDAAAPGRRRTSPSKICSALLMAGKPRRAVVGGLAFLLVSMAVLIPGRLALAERPNSSLSRYDNRKAKATSSRAARDSAIRSIPFDKLSPEARQKVAAVVKKTTVFRRLPVQVIDCNPDLYLYFTENPDVVVDIWEMLGVSQLALTRIGPTTFKADDGEGTLGTIEYLYNSHDTHVVYCEGKYDGPLFQKPIRGKCLIVLRSGYVRETNGRYYITSRLDTFVCLDHIGAEVLARTFQPLIGKVADYNFLETTAFLASMSHTAEVNPGGVQRLATGLDNVSHDARQRLLMLCDKINVEASIARTAARKTGRPIGK